MMSDLSRVLNKLYNSNEFVQNFSIVLFKILMAGAIG
jgi:hypothetical protein